MKQLFILFFLAGISSQVLGQRVCGTVSYHQSVPKAAPSEVIVTEGLARDTFANEIINIPVVVHVLYHTASQNISEAQIKSQLLILNNDFNQKNANAVNIPTAFKSAAGTANINFCLAAVVRQPTSKINFDINDDMKFFQTGGSDAWDPSRYLNVWVCALKGRMLGYASAPGSTKAVDGVVISFSAFGSKGTATAPFNLGRTATHEIGHWLGLRHIWGDQDCGSDGVDDTPQQRSYNYGCPSFPRVNNCTTTPYGEMFMNFMDFTNDACMSLFTHGQIKKMRSLFSLGQYRNSFLNAPPCQYSGPSEGPAIPLPPPATEKEEISLQVFPNPTSSYFTLHIKLNGLLPKNSEASLFSISGKLLWKTEVQPNGNKYQMQHLPAGIYYLYVSIGELKKRYKIVKI